MRFTNNISDLTLYTLSDELYFCDIENYKHGKEYINIVKSTLKNWNIYKDRVFFHCQPLDERKMLKSGWKIHISSTPNNSKNILEIVAKICCEYKTSFKFIMDEKIRDMSNGKTWSRSSSGKFITVYPNSTNEFELLIEILYKSLKKFTGPYILTDKRYKDCKVLYYRYGTISPEVLRYADGREFHLFDSPNLEVDRRQPYYYKPSWVAPPSFEEKSEIEDITAELSLKNGRYLIENVISFSTSGGVYIASDRQNYNNKVVIKEARPYTLTNIYHDYDAIDSLKKEYENLVLLNEVNCIPNPVDYFIEWEHTFMVQEYIDYDSLNDFSASKSIMLNPSPTKVEIKQFNDLIEKLFLNISMSVKSIHDLGYSINDLSPNNIMISEKSLDIKIIDLEGLVEINNRKNVYTMTTPGYTPKYTGDNRNSFLNDLYGLGAIMFDTLFSGTIFKSIKADFYEKIIGRVKKDYQLSNKICYLILELTSSSSKIENVDEVIRVLRSSKNHYSLLTNVTDKSNYDFRNKLKYHLENQLENKKLKDFLFPLRQNDFNVEHGLFGIYHIINYCKDVKQDKKVLGQCINVNTIVEKVKLPGLYNGKSGIAWVLMELGYEEEAVKIIQLANLESRDIKNYSLYCGLSGISLTNLYFYLKLEDKNYLNKAIELANIIMSNSNKNDKGLYWKNEEQEKKIGYLEGSTGISLLFIYLFYITKNPTYLNIAKSSLNHDLSFVETHFNNVKSLSVSYDENITKVSPYIDSGSAGVVLVLLRLLKYDMNAEKSYKELFDELIIDCQRIYTAYPTFFEGLSGLGNTLLDCYNFTSNPKYKEFALQIAETIKCYELEIDEKESCIPGVHLLRSSNDFATGTSGVLGFMERLLTDKHDFSFTLDHLLQDKN